MDSLHRGPQQHILHTSSSDSTIASILNRISAGNQFPNHHASMASPSNMNNFENSAHNAQNLQGQYKGQPSPDQHHQENARQHASGIPAISQGSWPAFEDIANALATDFDASLSGLGNFSHDQNFGTDNATSSEDAMNKPILSPKDQSSNESGSNPTNNKRRIEAISTDQILSPSEIKQEKAYSGPESRYNNIFKQAKEYPARWF